MLALSSVIYIIRAAGRHPRAKSMAYSERDDISLGIKTSIVVGKVTPVACSCPADHAYLSYRLLA